MLKGFYGFYGQNGYESKSQQDKLEWINTVSPFWREFHNDKTREYITQGTGREQAQQQAYSHVKACYDAWQDIENIQFVTEDKE
ncbi:MAG: hypothetical protein ACOX5R_20345 [bacterium]